MKSLILAAGRGSRMGSGTQNAPKCFTSLAGKKLIQWQIAALNKAGIETVWAVGGYLKEKLESEVTVPFVNEKWDQTNSVRTLMQASEVLSSENCVVSYSDILFHPQHIKELMNGRGNLRITYDTEWLKLWSLRAENPLLDAETFRQNNSWVKEIGAKPNSLEEIQGQYMGLLYFTPEAWHKTEELLKSLPAETVDKMDITSLLSRLLNIGLGIGAVGIRGKWCEVDTLTDVSLYQDQINGCAEWMHDWRW